MPSDLAQDLRRIIPQRYRSKFITEALREKLNRKKNLKKQFVASLRANAKHDMEITKDFELTDAETLKYIP